MFISSIRSSCFHSYFCQPCLFSLFINAHLHNVSTADVIVISLDPSWLSWSWEDSSEGRRRSNWGSTTSLTLTVLFHHLYHGDTWSWRRRDKCERLERAVEVTAAPFPADLNYPGSFSCQGQRAVHSINQARVTRLECPPT